MVVCSVRPLGRENIEGERFVGSSSSQTPQISNFLEANVQELLPLMRRGPLNEFSTIIWADLRF